MCTFGAPAAFVTTGKVMYEFTLESTGAAVLAGWATKSFERSDDPAYHYVGYAHGWSFSVTERRFLSQPNNIASMRIGGTDGDVIGVAVDLDAGTIHFAQNGVWVQVPSRNVDATVLRTGVYPAISGNGCIVLLNLGAQPFRYPLDGFAPIATSVPLGECERIRGDPSCFQTTPVWRLDALQQAAREPIRWVRQRMSEHREAHEKRWASAGQSAPAPLRVMDDIPVVSSIVGGELSVAAARRQLEQIVVEQPPLLPSIGVRLPATWLPAMAMVRALREGANPEAAARRAHEHAARAEAEAESPLEALRVASPGEEAIEPMRYASEAELHEIWQRVAAGIGVAADEALLGDVLGLLDNQGEVFRSSGLVFLDPAFTTAPLKPLVDHRLGAAFVIEKVRDVRHAKVLIAGVDALVKHGEVMLPPAQSNRVPPLRASSSCLPPP